MGALWVLTSDSRTAGVRVNMACEHACSVHTTRVLMARVYTARPWTRVSKMTAAFTVVWTDPVCDVFSTERGWSRQDEVWWLTFASCHPWFQLPSLLWHCLFGNSNGICKPWSNVLFRGCSRSYCNSDKRPAKQKLIALSNIGSKGIKILLDMDSSVSDMQTAGHSITTHHGELQAAKSLRCVPAWRWWYIGPVVVGNVGDNSVSSYRLHVSETQQLADATPICYLCGVARGQPSTNNGPTCKILVVWIVTS